MKPRQDKPGKNDKRKEEGEDVAKLPFIKFYGSDWRHDTKYLPLEVRGAWLEILLEMHMAEPRGQLQIPIKRLNVLLGDNSQKTVDILGVLKTEGIAEIEWIYNANDKSNSVVMIVSRRMKREGDYLKNNRLRQKRFRDKQKGNE